MEDYIFNKRYSKRKEWSNGFKNLQPIISLIHELYYHDNGLLYVRIIEEELLKRGIVPFKIEAGDGLYQIEHFNYKSADLRELQKHIWYIVKKQAKQA